MKNKIKIVYIMTSCRKCGPTQQTLSIIKNLDRKIYDPILVTIYKEGPDSRLKDFLPYVVKHHNLLISKKAILLRRNKKMRDFINTQKPDKKEEQKNSPNHSIHDTLQSTNRSTLSLNPLGFIWKLYNGLQNNLFFNLHIN